VLAAVEMPMPRQALRVHAGLMLGGLLRLILFRFLGARIMLGLAILGWLRRQLSGRRDPRQAEDRNTRRSTRASAYQPSQGSSQIVQREPR
jgi:hypothetical protein